MQNLSIEQDAAVSSDADKTLVIANAGSGKTRVLISRVEHLLSQGVSGYDIMCFSFTRKSSQEMRERLKEKRGSCENVRMGTMHSLALQFIHNFIGEKITIYSPIEEKLLLEDVCKELGFLKNGKWRKVKKKDISKMFSDFYEKGSSPYSDPNIQLYSIFNSFQERCQQNSAYTYGMLLHGLESIISIIAEHHNFKHILVDEVQDLDLMQWNLINEMVKQFGAKLYIVGDIDQCIYSFRGAEPDYLIKNIDQFKVFELSANYRSDKKIVKAANNLISNNTDRIDKVAIANSKDDGEIFLVSNVDSGNAKNMIIDLVSKNENKRSMIILARNHFLLKKLSRLLIGAGIYHNYVGEKTSTINTVEFVTVHAVLKLMVNPFDNFSFMVLREHLGIDSVEYTKIRLKAVELSLSHYQVWLQYFEDTKGFKSVINFPIGFNLTRKLLDFFTVYCEEVEYYDAINFLSHYWGKFRFKDVKQYLSWLSTYDIQDELESDDNQLNLMTIHAAKGLEADTVFILGLNDAILPSKHGFKDVSEMESERRLMYVAITRARKKLFITSRPTQDENGELISRRSMFIGECFE